MHIIYPVDSISACDWIVSQKAIDSLLVGSRYLLSFGDWKISDWIFNAKNISVENQVFSRRGFVTRLLFRFSIGGDHSNKKMKPTRNISGNTQYPSSHNHGNEKWIPQYYKTGPCQLRNGAITPINGLING